MARKQFITADRISDLLYWNCPGRACSRYYNMVCNGPTPRTIHCQCGHTHIVEQVTQITRSSARILVEVKE